jgi:hypothetical protein
MRRLFLTVSAVLVFPTVAAAQGRPAPRRDAPVAPRHYDFDNDVVQGTIQAPDGASVDVTRRARMPSLVKVRANFVPEMIKSADDT